MTTFNSGHGAASTKCQEFVVDNTTDGFDLYTEAGTFVQNFQIGIPIKWFPRQVVFGENSEVIVGGSDHREVYVFDRETGTLLDTLNHGNKALIQAVAISGKVVVHLFAELLEDSPQRGHTHDCEHNFTCQKQE